MCVRAPCWRCSSFPSPSLPPPLTPLPAPAPLTTRQQSSRPLRGCGPAYKRSPGPSHAAPLLPNVPPVVLFAAFPRCWCHVSVRQRARLRPRELPFARRPLQRIALHQPPLLWRVCPTPVPMLRCRLPPPRSPPAAAPSPRHSSLPAGGAPCSACNRTPSCATRRARLLPTTPPPTPAPARPLRAFPSVRASPLAAPRRAAPPRSDALSRAHPLTHRHLRTPSRPRPAHARAHRSAAVPVRPAPRYAAPSCGAASGPLVCVQPLRALTTPLPTWYARARPTRRALPIRAPTTMPAPAPADAHAPLPPFARPQVMVITTARRWPQRAALCLTAPPRPLRRRAHHPASPYTLLCVSPPPSPRTPCAPTSSRRRAPPLLAPARLRARPSPPSRARPCPVPWQPVESPLRRPRARHLTASLRHAPAPCTTPDARPSATTRALPSLVALPRLRALTACALTIHPPPTPTPPSPTALQYLYYISEIPCL